MGRPMRKKPENRPRWRWINNVCLNVRVFKMNGDKRVEERVKVSGGRFLANVLG